MRLSIELIEELVLKGGGYGLVPVALQAIQAQPCFQSELIS